MASQLHMKCNNWNGVDAEITKKSGVDIESWICVHYSNNRCPFVIIIITILMKCKVLII